MYKSNQGLIRYAKLQVGKPYWFGTFGQRSTPALYASKKSQYPSYYTDSDFERQLGLRVHDCVGLIKGYLWSTSYSDEPVYDASQDVSARGMYSISKKRGKIWSLKKVDGVLVYKGSSPSKIHHVGVYCTDGYVYEAKGHRWGVVKTPFKKSDWDYWSFCPFVEYNMPKKRKTGLYKVAHDCIFGKYGVGDERVRRLIQAGFDPEEVQFEINRILKG